MARTAHGVVTRRALLAAGVTEAEIRQRMRCGSLVRAHPGVYRVGHAAPLCEADHLAAVLACGPRALLCARAAGWVFGVLKGASPVPEVVGPTARRIAGVRTRRSRRMRADEATMWRGIPITTVARTLVDLAGVLSFDELARACHEAGVLHRTTPREVAVVLARTPSARGTRALRAILGGDAPVTLSGLERRFLARLREAGLALPVTNRLAGGRRVDCRWPGLCLTVELDSYRYHSSRHAWEQDRRREREARARGDEFRRYTYGDVFEEPALMLAELCALLPPARHRPNQLSQGDSRMAR